MLRGARYEHHRHAADERLPIKTRIAEYDDNLVRAGDPRANSNVAARSTSSTTACGPSSRLAATVEPAPTRHWPRSAAGGPTGARHARVFRRGESMCWCAPPSSRAVWTYPTPTPSSSIMPTSSAWRSSTSCAGESAERRRGPTPTCCSHLAKAFGHGVTRRLKAISRPPSSVRAGRFQVRDVVIAERVTFWAPPARPHRTVGFDSVHTMLAQDGLKKTLPAAPREQPAEEAGPPMAKELARPIAESLGSPEKAAGLRHSDYPAAVGLRAETPRAPGRPPPATVSADGSPAL